MTNRLPYIAAALGIALSFAGIAPAAAEPDEGAPGSRVLSSREAQNLQISRGNRDTAQRRDEGKYLILTSDSDDTPAPPLGRTPSLRAQAPVTVDASAAAPAGSN